MENSIEIPQKFNVEIPYDLAVLLHIYLKEITVSQRDICTPMFIVAFFHNTHDMKTTCVLQGDEKNVTHTHTHTHTHMHIFQQ